MATMRYPLTLSALLDRAERFFPDKQIVSRTESGVHRYHYQAFGNRVRQLAASLLDLGVTRGERVATFAWNHYRHMEAYVAIPCMGAVCHTLNIWFTPEQLVQVINHAGDKVLLVDVDLLPAIEAIAPALTTVEHYIIMADHLPLTTLPNAHSYEALVAAARPLEQWPQLDEWDIAGMCYSSATDGVPKGIQYTHRALWLESMALCMVDSAAVSERDTWLCTVPMFHANAWGIPYAALWVGAKQVFPGVHPTPHDLCGLIATERVTLTAGVPTVLIGVLSALGDRSYDIRNLERILCGGSAVPEYVIRDFAHRYGVAVIQGYGMTEAAPMTHFSIIKSHLDHGEASCRLRNKAGLPIPGLERRVVDAVGRDVPWDDRTVGEVWLRGPWVADEYYRDARTAAAFRDGWFHTADMGVVDAEGYLSIVDREKDLIKSGGEWISSLRLDACFVTHPAVAEAAVVGVAHRKWQERPVACVVLRPGFAATESELLAHVRRLVVSWWVPDAVVFLPALPKTGVGKVDKRALRSTYAGVTISHGTVFS